MAHATGIVGSERARLVAACDLDEATLREFEMFVFFASRVRFPSPPEQGHA